MYEGMVKVKRSAPRNKDTKMDGNSYYAAITLLVNEPYFSSSFMLDARYSRGAMRVLTHLQSSITIL